MYQDSPKWLRRMDYCNEVHDFINYALFNLRNISRDDIRCRCKSCKNKKFLTLDVVMMRLLQKGFIKRYLFWFAHEEPYIPHEIMVERMVKSTYNFSNVHAVVDDNSNLIRI